MLKLSSRVALRLLFTALPTLVGVPALLVTGCDTEGSASFDQTGAPASLEIYALDLWAQELPSGAFTLTVERDGAAVSGKLDGAKLTLPLEKAGHYVVTLTSKDHHDLVATLDFAGDAALDGLSLAGASEGHGAALSHAEGAGQKPVHRLYLGLRHKWFSAEGRPARRGNQVDLLMDGEEAWKTVHEELIHATKHVMVSTWWWESDFELVRPEATHATMSEDERRENTILGVLEGIPAEKRVLVGQLWGQDGVLSGMTVDAGLTAHADDLEDHFEFMGQANPTRGKFTFQIPDFLFSTRLGALDAEAPGQDFDPDFAVRSTVASKEVDLTQWPVSFDTDHASVHQKFMVVDDDVAFVGGMNLRRVDWDTSEHRVFDARRMLFGATSDERLAVAAKSKQPDTGPRKDYMTRIEGPAAQDVADVFHARWEQAIADKVKHSDTVTHFEVARDLAAEQGGLQVQVTTTLPEPYWEHGIIESWLNAVGQAERYVYIEDQYFRAPILNDALYARMKEKPELRLVVITKPINEWTDPGCRWTYESAQEFSEAFPDRFLFLQLRAFDTQVVPGFDETDGVFADLDVHSKMLIVDDKFMSVGSCNKNNRGMIYEAEMNLAVLDEAWVKAARRRILENILPSGAELSDDSGGWFDALATAAQSNDKRYAAWDAEGFDLNLEGAQLPPEYRPAGLLYSLPIHDVSDCLLESIGPDMTGSQSGGEDPSDPGPAGE